jgi:hypothetical protein
MSNKPNKQVASVVASSGREALDAVWKCIVVFGVAGAVVLAIVATKALGHSTVNPFMWVRSVVLVVIAPVLYRFAVSASNGSRGAFDRLRFVSLVLPIAIVVVDLIPGVCPVWYAAVQGATAIPLIAVALITGRKPLRSSFAAAR